MKKLVHTGKILTILSLIVLQGCKKDKKTDFPTQSTSSGNFADYVYRTPSVPVLGDADAILVSVQAHNFHVVTVSPVEQESEYGMARFANSTGNFSSLADADSVWINSTNCVKASDLSYLSSITNYSINFSTGITWKAKGSSSVAAFTQSVSGGLPAYNLWPHSTSSSATWNDAWIPTFPRDTAKPRPQVFQLPDPTPPFANHTDSVRWLTSKDSVNNYNSTYYYPYKADSLQFVNDSTWNATPFAVIPIKNYTVNSDSVYIIFNDGAVFNFQRRVPATDSLCILRPNDFASLKTTALNSANLTLQINVIKYNPVMIGSKKYYFLKMGSYIRYWKPS